VTHFEPGGSYDSLHAVECEIDLGGGIIGNLAGCRINSSYAGNEKTIVRAFARTGLWHRTHRFTSSPPWSPVFDARLSVSQYDTGNPGDRSNSNREIWELLRIRSADT
jgi:hypothetical protein